ncbi:MAG: sensor histidine kinase N-terminal domain-containing protein, partial [Gammaproteobacteria bacterium]|nr:sensor histidine kinase N-terminal domain-containing protein [Gammaproteobacteria bacterium]
MSIRYHLMLRLFLVLLVFMGAGAFISFNDLQHETRELFDAQLARSARLILSLVQADSKQTNFSTIQQFLNENRLHPPAGITGEENDDEQEELDTGHIYETKLGFQVWDNFGNLILKSPNVPLTPISQDQKGFSNNKFLDHDWRIFSLSSQDSRYRCIAAERIDVRNDLIGDISADLSIL